MCKKCVGTETEIRTGPPRRCREFQSDHIVSRLTSHLKSAEFGSGKPLTKVRKKHWDRYIREWHQVAPPQRALDSSVANGFAMLEPFRMSTPVDRSKVVDCTKLPRSSIKAERRVYLDFPLANVLSITHLKRRLCKSRHKQILRTLRLLRFDTYNPRL